MLVREARRWGSLVSLLCSIVALAACKRPAPRASDDAARANAFRTVGTAYAPPPRFVQPMAPGISGFSVRYNASPNPVHAQLRAQLERNHVLEGVAAVLNHTVRLPVPVQIQTIDCSMINAFYDEHTRRITVCYELVDHFLDEFRRILRNPRQLENAVVGATLFTFYHEAAHGIISLLDLPAVGREEDAADQLATLSLLNMGDAGARMAIASAHWFQLESRTQPHATPFWDEHAFDAQRFYNVLCLVYGSNPGRYQELVASGELPMQRAGRCSEEYEKITRAWNRLLQPYYARRPAPRFEERYSAR